MATQPLVPPKFRAFDANGNPLSGGLLYTYAAGTTTPLATYTTRAGSVANANPVVLDANGEADVWTTPGVDYKFELRSSAGVVQWTVDNYPSPADESAATADVSTDPGGRLTLTSGTPVTTADVTAATTVYYTPYRHNKVPLYDGTSWTLYSLSTELSQSTTDTTKSPAAVANNSNYDLFVWSDSGTLRLSRGPAWSSSTSRGSGAGTTEIGRVDGRWTNKVSISNGPAAQRGLYVGTIRSNGSAQINDSLAFRHVWNMYGRVERAMRVVETTNTWTYSTFAWRQANGSAANQLDYVVGLAEDPVQAQTIGFATGPSVSDFYSVGIGVDSAGTPMTPYLALAGVIPVANQRGGAAMALFDGFPAGAGRHTLQWLEFSSTTGTMTWMGDNGATDGVFSTGISGRVRG